MASVWVLPTIAGVIGVLVTGVTTFVVIRLNKSSTKIDIAPNASFIDLGSRNMFTNGYTFGLIKREIPRKNKTTLIEFYPLDYEQGENKPRPEMQSIIVGNEYIKRFAAGEYAPRPIVKLMPRSRADLPEKMRNTDEGDWMTKEGQKAWIIKTFGESITAGDEAIHEAMRSFARGNITRAALSQVKEENAEFRKLFLSEQKNEGENKKQ